MTRARRYVRTLAMLLTVTFLTTAVYAVDGVILIDQNKALAGGVTPGDAPGYPIQITKGGSYKLSGDLTVADLTTTGFSLETNQPVTIDFNGFSLSGPNAGQTQPCQAVTPGKGVWSPHSAIRTAWRSRAAPSRAWDATGSCSSASPTTCTTCGSATTARTGIQVTGVILNNSISNNGGEGISTFNAVITGNEITDNEKEGIVSFAGTVSNNTISQNTDEGLFVPGSGGNPGTSVGYSNNSFRGNNGGGAQVFGGIQLGSNICGPLGGVRHAVPVAV